MLLAFAVVSAGVPGVLLWQLRSDAIASAEKLGGSFARLTGEHTAGALQTLERALQSAERRLSATLAAGAATPESIRLQLIDSLRGREFLSALWVLDERGLVVYHTDPGRIGVDMSDRRYFALHRDNPASKFELDAPSRDPVSAGWFIPATRAWRGQDGQFRGVIVAAMEPQFFDQAWTLDDEASDTTIALFRQDGMMLMRSPFVDGYMGRVFPGFARIESNVNAGIFHVDNAADGESRLMAWRRLRTYPGLIVVVTQSTSRVLAGWRETVWIVAAGWAIAMATLGGLAIRLAGEWKERQIAERQRQQAMDDLRELMEVSSDWIWQTDADHRLEDLVSAVPHMTEIGTKYAGLRRWEQPNSRPMVGTWAEYIAILDARQELRGFEYETIRVDGSIQVSRVSGRPRFDEQGKFIGYRGSGQDVTEQRADQLARAVNQRLFETSLDLILATDARGRFVLVSPSAATMLGYDPKEMTGRSAADFVYPEDLDSVRHEMRRARRGRVTRHFDCRYVSRDGRAVPLAWTGVWSEVDRHHFFIGRDMSERLAAEERKRQSQRLEALGQLTGGIAHDFNNILSIMMIKMESVLEDLPDISPERARLASALAAGTRGADLVSRLMTFARKRPLTPRDASIRELLDELTVLLSTALTRRVSLSLDIAGDPHCVVDRTGLESALLNLAVNARDAMPDGGELHISARHCSIGPEDVDARPSLKLGQWIEIAVRDTGVGMTSEIQAKVFEPFFTTKGEGKGTGLGLAMVHGFVNQSGGFVTLRSEVGQGTTFSLYLPAPEVVASAVAA